jgi:hypothetical protein
MIWDIVVNKEVQEDMKDLVMIIHQMLIILLLIVKFLLMILYFGLLVIDLGIIALGENKELELIILILKP